MKHVGYLARLSTMEWVGNNSQGALPFKFSHGLPL